MTKEKIEVKVYNDLEEAVAAAALQNYNRDARTLLEVVSWEEADEKIKETYLDEVRWLLSDSGENYLPEEPDTTHICYGTK